MDSGFGFAAPEILMALWQTQLLVIIGGTPLIVIPGPRKRNPESMPRGRRAKLTQN
jgi:hypothetical protein